MTTRTTGYYVQCLDGPAEGWAYHTLIAPDQRIIVVPGPRGWFRVPPDGPPWIGECRYERDELPMLGALLTDDQVTSDGEILANYRVKPATAQERP